MLHAAAGRALERGLELEGLTVERPTLEDVYLRLVGAATPATAPVTDSTAVPEGAVDA